MWGLLWRERAAQKPRDVTRSPEWADRIRNCGEDIPSLSQTADSVPSVAGTARGSEAREGTRQASAASADTGTMAASAGAPRAEAGRARPREPCAGSGCTRTLAALPEGATSARPRNHASPPTLPTKADPAKPINRRPPTAAQGPSTVLDAARRTSK